ncbi:MAG: hypothetical protein GY702_14135 [Desulfobulbaceae bacterium]|nr:hypothetical protein [Desulfobulbaceae bacterium]
MKIHTCSANNYKGYTGRNPKSGEEVQVESKKRPFIRPGRS